MNFPLFFASQHFQNFIVDPSAAFELALLLIAGATGKAGPHDHASIGNSTNFFDELVLGFGVRCCVVLPIYSSELKKKHYMNILDHFGICFSKNSV